MSYDAFLDREFDRVHEEPACTGCSDQECPCQEFAEPDEPDYDPSCEPEGP